VPVLGLLSVWETDTHSLEGRPTKSELGESSQQLVEGLNS